jgi:hypothetical protein
MASLLGTGVTVVVRLDTSIALDFVFVSFRHWAEVSSLLADSVLVDGEGLATAAAPATPVLEKKPRMLCCLPVDGAFLTVGGAFAGVRAALAVFSPILSDVTENRCCGYTDMTTKIM